MEKIRVYRQKRELPQRRAGAAASRWIVEWTTDYGVFDTSPEERAINVYDSFAAAQARAKELERVVYGCADTAHGYRLEVAECIAGEILKDVPPIKKGAGRGRMVSVAVADGSHVLMTKSAARKLGIPVIK